MSQTANISPNDLIMDTRRGGQDSQYYCLPLFHGEAERGVKRLYLVVQGHVVGVFDDWRVVCREQEFGLNECFRLSAKASVSGFPDNSYRAYKSMDECIIAWQALCQLGLHPHPVDPEFDHTARGPLARAVWTPPPSTTQVETPRRAGVGALRKDPTATPSPAPPARRATPPSPKTPVRQAAADEGEFLNFAIRGAGIVSSSVSRTERCYRELQSRGEEPELLVTRSLQETSFFAVDDSDKEQLSALENDTPQATPPPHP
ncbi:hypothetical protein K438DRAFT_1967517 [Mycena galopus ATCC 62051]|nr:hypothetical protein K438DRAFT_1967517 [Mycena galopus ATCC 62051]